MDHDGVRWSVPGAEMCFRCDGPTGNAGRGDDSLYDTSGAGPYCHSCFELVAALAAKDARIAEFESLARMVVDGQLTETEHERGIYRRGFRELLAAAKGE